MVLIGSDVFFIVNSLIGLQRAKRAILAHYNVSSSSKESMKSLTDKDRESIKC